MKFLIIIYLSIGSFLTFAQKHNSFPEGWEGKWQGNLDINFVNGGEMAVNMELHIIPLTDTSWQWVIVYRTDSTEDIRDYTLYQTRGSAHYTLDEHNGIELYLSAIGNGMYSSFDVAGSDLMIFYELEGDELVFRTLSSGNGKWSGGKDDVPKVIARETVVSQKAVLKQLKD